MIPESAQLAAGAAPSAEPEDDERRLARAVDALVARFHELRGENARLRRELAEHEERLRELNQRRQDALKRMDDLIARIEELDEGLEAAT